MKYKYQVVKKIFKKDGWKFSLLFLGLFLLLLICELAISGRPKEEGLISLLGVPNAQMSFLDILWLSFQIFMVFYFSYAFYKYERDNSYEFIVCRISRVRFYLSKILFLSLLILLFRTVYYFLLSMVFADFSFEFLVYNVLFYSGVSLMAFFVKW